MANTFQIRNLLRAAERAIEDGHDAAAEEILRAAEEEAEHVTNTVNWQRRIARLWAAANIREN